MGCVCLILFIVERVCGSVCGRESEIERVGGHVGVCVCVCV
jgi:hypothetical protein